MYPRCKFSPPAGTPRQITAQLSRALRYENHKKRPDDNRATGVKKSPRVSQDYKDMRTILPYDELYLYYNMYSGKEFTRTILSLINRKNTALDTYVAMVLVLL